MVSSTSPTDTNGVSETDTANGTGNINQGNSKTKRADDGEGNSRTEEKVTTDDSQGLANAVEVKPTKDGKVTVLQGIEEKQMNETNAEALALTKEQMLKIYQNLPQEVQKQHPEIPQKILEMKSLAETGKPFQAVKQYLSSPTIRQLM